MSTPLAEPHPSAPRRGRSIFALLAVLLVAAVVAHLLTGSVRIPIGEALRILVGGEARREAWRVILLEVRLPRALTGILAGAALATAGLLMQTMFRNPLAGPFVLGISSGASLGVAVLVLGAGVLGGLERLGFIGDFGVAAAASLGAGAAMVLVLIAARKVQSTMTLLVLGLMFGYATGAVVSLLSFLATAEHLQQFTVWTFGSFSNVDWQQMGVFAGVTGAALLVAQVLVKPLNALLIGETYARSMGLTVDRARLCIIGLAALLAGTVTAFCGPIAFVGIAVPHLARSLLGSSDHKALLPATGLLGAAVMVLADLVAQLPGSERVLPLSAVTSILGAPIVTWVILRRQNLRSSFAG